MVAELTASQQRSQDPALVASLSFPTLLDKLPLSLPVPADTPPSPKTHYRSQYTYLGYKDLLDPAVWSTLSLFDLALRLIDFSSLEATLSQTVYAPSARGHVPFHPVSMFLLRSWCVLGKWHRTIERYQLPPFPHPQHKLPILSTPSHYPLRSPSLPYVQLWFSWSISVSTLLVTLA